MKKFYLLPISLLLLNQSFSAEFQQKFETEYEENYDELALDDLKSQVSAMIDENEFSDDSNAEEYSEQEAPRRSNADRMHSRAVDRRENAHRIQKSTSDERQVARKRPLPEQGRNQAYNDSNNSQKGQQGQMRNNNMQNSSQMKSDEMMMYNKSARPAVNNGWDVWAMADLLVWQATEENLTYATSGSTQPSASTDKFSNKQRTLSFDWHCGFRAGIGYNTPHDGWDIGLYWLRIENFAKGHKKSGGPDNQISQLYFGNVSELPSPITSAKAKWKSLLNQADLNLGREFYVGKMLTIQPFLGVRSTWLEQKEKIRLTNDASGHLRNELKNSFWGFGFVGGLNTDWMLGSGFSLYGNTDFAILLGFFDDDQTGKFSNVAASTTTRDWSLDKSFRAGRAILDLAMGFKWSGLFCNDSYGITFKAGYEYHLYFDQNQINYNIAGPDAGTARYFVPIQGNLIYQGVTLSGQIDF